MTRLHVYNSRSAFRSRAGNVMSASKVVIKIYRSPVMSQTERTQVQHAFQSHETDLVFPPHALSFPALGGAPPPRAE